MIFNCHVNCTFYVKGVLGRLLADLICHVRPPNLNNDMVSEGYWNTRKCIIQPCSMQSKLITVHHCSRALVSLCLVPYLYSVVRTLERCVWWTLGRVH